MAGLKSRPFKTKFALEIKLRDQASRSTLYAAVP